jgi:ParB family transcriptional regulator, chromosome partitioning protein
MTTTSIVRNIPLDRLVLSPTNVRKSPASASEDAELKASIRAGGLKQNLIVCPEPGKPERFAVTAGGHRLKVLQELAAEGGRDCSRGRARLQPRAGAIAADCEVPCLVEAPDAAPVRAAMHPADETPGR